MEKSFVLRWQTNVSGPQWGPNLIIFLFYIFPYNFVFFHFNLWVGFDDF